MAVLPPVWERGRNVFVLTISFVLRRILSMPSLFRFLVVIGIIGGLGYAAVFALANFVPFKPREIVQTVPPDKFVKQPH
jgi:hypothetical protein